MSRQPPQYFVKIQQAARSRWDQLEADPVLAGPWRQLFLQVQSPRHVLSELLQNADDAGATWVMATFKNNLFEFVHNGEDFNEETLQSLCQFGLSNKRHLHTIGFRGVGFKSVFSICSKVQIITPTIAFSFDKNSFTLPVWLSGAPLTNGETRIRVLVDKDGQGQAILSEFQRWIKSPIPLLFFSNVSRLEIQDETIHKENAREGPLPGSYYITLSNQGKQEVLIIQSSLESFPDETLEEIREERGSSTIELPPCRVQIVLTDSEKRLYTVLPTDVRPSLPFSLNGPFVQDPARTAIKHPVNSPTNRWLLTRIGALAAKSMVQWLKSQDLPLAERAHAYRIMPKLSQPDGSLDQVTTSIILDSFKKALVQYERIVLTHDGSLASKAESIDVPNAILETWGPEESLKIFANNKSKAVAKEIEVASIQRLKSWSLIEELSKKDIVEKLSSLDLPKPACPQPIERLFPLWEYLQPLADPSNWEFRKKVPELNIVPVEGQNQLLASTQVVVLGGKETGISEENWNFLISLVDLVSREWVNVLSEAKQDVAEDQAKKATKGEMSKNRTTDLFNKLGLNQKVGLEQIINKAARKVFSEDDPGAIGIKLAQVAAQTATRVPDHCKYLCRDDKWRAVPSELLIESLEDLEGLLPKNTYQAKVIADRYVEGLGPEQLKQWYSWITSFEKSRLNSFLIPSKKERRFYYRSEAEKFFIERGGQKPARYYYKDPYFEVEDWDWPEICWQHWQLTANEDPGIWKQVTFAVLRGWNELWQKREEANVRECWRDHSWGISHNKLAAAWLHKLRSIACIPDTHGNLHLPAELCRLTSDTQPLLNVEKFVHADFDKPEYAKALDLLGVRSQASGCGPLIDRLKALSQTTTPPISHLVDLYRALDRVSLHMAPEEVRELKETFASEKLIYTNDKTWEKLDNVYKDNPDGIPGVSVIHSEASNLALWDRMKVPEKPTLEMAIEWLKNRPFGMILNPVDRTKAIQIIRRAPSEVWQKCQGWIDSSGRWTSSADLKWATSNREIVVRLFDSVKRTTADFSIIDNLTTNFVSMTGLRRLENALEQRLINKEPTGTANKMLWLQALSEILIRIRYDHFDNEDLTSMEEDKATAYKLRDSVFQPVLRLRVAPFLDGHPAGPEGDRKVIWDGKTIYVKGKSPSHYRELVEELCRHFHNTIIRRVIADCIDREPEWISGYALENLKLEEVVVGEISRDEIKSDGEEKSHDKEDSGEEKIPTDLEHNSSDKERESKQEDVKENDDTVAKAVRKRQQHLKDGFSKLLEDRGFVPSGDGKYINSKAGSHVERSADGPTQWIEYDSSGNIRAAFWVGHGSLEKGFEIPAATWNLAQTSGHAIYIVLVNEDGANHQHSLQQLLDMSKIGQIELNTTRMLVRAKERVLKE